MISNTGRFNAHCGIMLSATWLHHLKSKQQNMSYQFKKFSAGQQNTFKVSHSMKTVCLIWLHNMCALFSTNRLILHTVLEMGCVALQVKWSVVRILRFLIFLGTSTFSKYNSLLVTRWMDGLGFYVPSTVFQSFRDDGRMNMKGSVQWSAV